MSATPETSSKPSTLTDPRRLSEFTGCWRLTKHIRHADGATARFEGVAVWTPADGVHVCEEQGQLQMGGGPAFHAHRRYLWHPGLRVHFDDGRLFHIVPATGGAVSHDCAPDHYAGHYDFARWPEFTVDWDVDGPRKSYRMRCTYRRVA